ncbi:MAG: sigma-54-dependent Fis family transcriptional regulator [Myxococcales bacterium]|nr:sigma-54-dependent Fis family transcriptional regulator [Myxococcales bacterium]
MNWDRESRWTRIRFFLDQVGAAAGSAFASRAVRVLSELTGADACWIRVDDVVLAQHLAPGAMPIALSASPADGASTLRQGDAWLVRQMLRDRSDGTERRVGELLVRLSTREPPNPGVFEFLDTVGELIAGRLKQQERVEQIQEQLREERTTFVGASHMGLGELVDRPGMASIRADADAAVVGDAPVLILGESGTGKTRLANAIAEASGRVPIVRATLGASDDLNTITSELFGHVRGAFSGAVAARKGLVEYADGGTLILDEVLNLPPHAQQLLLDFTQFGTYRPLGYQAAEPKRARVRLLAATNGDIRRAIADTRFRQDLYFRLASIPITLPPLRDCRADIPTLASAYLARVDRHRAVWTLSDQAKAALMSTELEWEGNIRELEGLLQRAVHRARAEGDTAGTQMIQTRHLGLTMGTSPTPLPPAATSKDISLSDRWRQLELDRDALDTRERDAITAAMTKSAGVVNRAARLLGVPRTSLLSRMKRLGIDKLEFAPEA